MVSVYPTALPMLIWYIKISFVERKKILYRTKTSSYAASLGQFMRSCDHNPFWGLDPRLLVGRDDSVRMGRYHNTLSVTSVTRRSVKTVTRLWRYGRLKITLLSFWLLFDDFYLMNLPTRLSRGLLGHCGYALREEVRDWVFHHDTK